MKTPVTLHLLFLLNCFLNIHITAQPLPSEINLSEQSPDSFLVSFETTKGQFIMKAHREWSPLGCDRFYVLVKCGFYNGCIIYRVAPTLSFKGGFIVQFGMVNNESVNRACPEREPVDSLTTGRPPVLHERSGGRIDLDDQAGPGHLDAEGRAKCGGGAGEFRHRRENDERRARGRDARARRRRSKLPELESRNPAAAARRAT